jgi:hypothetical protein
MERIKLITLIAEEEGRKERTCRMFRKELDMFCSKVCPVIHAMLSR